MMSFCGMGAMELYDLLSFHTFILVRYSDDGIYAASTLCVKADSDHVSVGLWQALMLFLDIHPNEHGPQTLVGLCPGKAYTLRRLTHQRPSNHCPNLPNSFGGKLEGDGVQHDPRSEPAD